MKRKKLTKEQVSRLDLIRRTPPRNEEGWRYVSYALEDLVKDKFPEELVEQIQIENEFFIRLTPIGDAVCEYMLGPQRPVE